MVKVYGQDGRRLKFWFCATILKILCSFQHYKNVFYAIAFIYRYQEQQIHRVIRVLSMPYGILYACKTHVYN